MALQRDRIGEPAFQFPDFREALRNVAHDRHGANYRLHSFRNGTMVN